MTNADAPTTELLPLAAENAELRLQLVESQDQCVEMAVDAGELQAEIEALRAQLADLERERNEWRRAAQWIECAVA
jgi:polyhydroxyalkanoate synthesis regulator phasin